MDVVTNVKTVKLFANVRHEDNAILAAMKGYFKRSLDRAEVMVLFRFLLLVLAGIMPIVLIGYSVVQWSNGLATVSRVFHGHYPSWLSLIIHRLSFCWLLWSPR